MRTQGEVMFEVNNEKKNTRRHHKMQKGGKHFMFYLCL